MADNRDKDRVEDVQEDLIPDKLAAHALPAVYVDTWFLSTWTGHVRITLGEEALPGRDQYRYAMVMELDIAERFAEHILEMVGRRKKARIRSEGQQKS